MRYEVLVEGRLGPLMLAALADSDLRPMGPRLTVTLQTGRHMSLPELVDGLADVGVEVDQIRVSE